ncbi:MAG: ABC-2 family transporter protein [Herpetosiphon sp.]
MGLRLYYEIGLRSFRQVTVYRLALVGGVVTNCFFAAVRCYLFRALYGAGGDSSGLSLTDAISYTWVTQALISVGGGWLRPDLMQTIRTGEVASDLARPWSFYGYWLSRTLGERCCNLLFRSTVTYGAGLLFFAVHVPTWPQAAAFAAALLLGTLVSFAYSFMVNLAAFWLVDSSGLLSMANALMMVFSGFLLPLALYPAWLRQVASVLPFQAMTGLPAELWLGRKAGAVVWQSLALETFWAIVMTLAALVTLRMAVHKVVIQGG